MAALYIFAGVSHFTKEKFFLAIVPSFLPYKRAIVQISGVIEILLGLGLLAGIFNASILQYAAWGVIILLIVVYPANIYMLIIRIQGKKFRKVPVWTLWVRLALQFGLIYWAYCYV